MPMPDQPPIDGVRTPRPHQKLTDDGRRMREVLSYARRGSRFTPRQRAAWETYAEQWWIADETVDSPDFTLAGCFEREAPLIVEIGCGIGESTLALAQARPERTTWLSSRSGSPASPRPWAGSAAAGLTNVRLLSVDAAWSLEHLIAPDSLAGLWIFFPDPWHKKKHHKRRLVTGEFAHLAATRLASGAEWRLATDWADYAEQMIEVLDSEDLLDGGRVERWAERPVTKFERKGLAVGREITDLTYRRV